MHLELRDIWPRKGGGGHGGGHGSGGHSSGGHSSGDDGDGGSSSRSGVSPSTGRPVTKPIILGSGSTSSSKAVPYALGSTSRFTLSSSSPFAGRLAGGAVRTGVYGTSRYGSGYTYGGYGSYTESRPFPYVFWPVYWGPHYYGDDEYNNKPSDRPGGPMASAVVQPNYTTSTNASQTFTFRIVGDNSSVIAIMDALSTNCSVVNATSTPYNPSNTSSPQPSEVLQYYRASSFALSLDIYNNTASSYASMPSSNTSAAPSAGSDTALPNGLNATFLVCINATIGAALPLLDPPEKSGLSKGAIVGIAIGCTVGALALIVLIWVFIVRKMRKFNRESLAVKYAGVSNEDSAFI